MSAYQFNITFYSDASLIMSRTNDTHAYTVSSGLLDAVWIEEHEYWYDWQTLAPNTVAGTNSEYEKILPEELSNLSLPESFVLNLTNEVVSNAGQQTLTLQLMRSQHSCERVMLPMISREITTEVESLAEADLTYEFLNLLREGTCSEFTTVFVTMARLAGYPQDLFQVTLVVLGQVMVTQFTAQTFHNGVR